METSRLQGRYSRKGYDIPPNPPRKSVAPSILQNKEVQNGSTSQSSWKIIQFFGSKIFTHRNSGKLIAATALNAMSSGLIVVSPFLFARLHQQNDDSIEFLGIKLNRFEVIASFAAGYFLYRVLPDLRKLTTNSIVSTTVYDSIYEYDCQILEQTHQYQVETKLGAKQEKMVAIREGATNFTAVMLQSIYPSLCEMGAATIALTYNYGWEVGAWTVGCMGISIGFNYLAGKSVSSAHSQYLRSRMESGGYAVGLWINFESIFYFNTLAHERSQLRKKLDTTRSDDLRNLNAPDTASLFHTFLAQGPLFGLMMYAGHQMLQGKHSLHDFSVIVYFILQISNPLKNIGESVNKVRAIFDELTPVIDFIENKKSNSDLPALRIPKTGAKLAFKNVVSSYKEEAVLKGISFEGRAGETIAIVGLTGGGKTSIARLLFGLYPVTGGTISINDQDISKVDISSLRDHLAIVPQNPVLFNNTLKYNIAYGAISNSEEEVSDEQILEAIEKAGLAEDVKKWSEGINKNVGEGALALSGGQLLRVAIARAIIRNAPIVILDEYTSALDSQTEAFLEKSLASVLKDKLKIVIAHRLSTIKGADKILVLDKGIIKEQGKFEELVKKDKGLFRAAWEKQQKNSTTSTDQDAVVTSTPRRKVLRDGKK